MHGVNHSEPCLHPPDVNAGSLELEVCSPCCAERVNGKLVCKPGHLARSPILSLNSAQR